MKQHRSEDTAEETRKTSGMSDLKDRIHEHERICENIEGAAGHQDKLSACRPVEAECFEALPPRYMEIRISGLKAPA
jgi:hypothetical protein